MNFCDSSFAIGESLREPGLRYLKQIKARNVAIEHHSRSVLLARIERVGGLLQFVFEGTGSEYFHLRVLTPEEEAQQKADHMALIARRHGEGMSLRDIAREVGISHMTVKRYLDSAA